MMLTQRPEEEMAMRRWSSAWSDTPGRAKKINQAADLKGGNRWSGQARLRKARVKSVARLVGGKADKRTESLAEC